MIAEIIAAVAAPVSGVVGYVIRAIGDHRHHELRSSELLMRAQQQLSDQMADNQLLWEHNRALIDHIYRRAPPPPPDPPAHLFDHDNKED